MGSTVAKRNIAYAYRCSARPRLPLSRSFAILSLLVALLLTSSGSTLAGEVTIETWAGHQVVIGEKTIPFLGRRQTRTDSYVIAQVTRADSVLRLKQLSCKVWFKKVAGVMVSMSNETLAQLPPAIIEFTLSGQIGRAIPWQVGWTGDDIDDDGAPGVSVTVDSSQCSGKLHLASNTESRATGTITRDGMVGNISVTVSQKVLGADSRCLRWFSADSTEHQKGTFAYRRISPDATCASLLQTRWPIRSNQVNIREKR